MVLDPGQRRGQYHVSRPGNLHRGCVLCRVAARQSGGRLREQRAALTEAERRAQTDPLTGVLNRNSLIERLHVACVRAQARGLPIALLFIDLDHFKQINDSFGHQAGGACLRAIIPPIHAELRQSDVVGRYGGEESGASTWSREPTPRSTRRSAPDAINCT
jgi:PleD family two-component response regulator